MVASCRCRRQNHHGFPLSWGFNPYLSTDPYAGASLAVLDSGRSQATGFEWANMYLTFQEYPRSSCARSRAPGQSLRRRCSRAHGLDRFRWCHRWQGPMSAPSRILIPPTAVLRDGHEHRPRHLAGAEEAGDNLIWASSRTPGVEHLRRPSTRWSTSIGGASCGPVAGCLRWLGETR